MFIHSLVRIIGKMFVTFSFTMSVNILESVIREGSTVFPLIFLKNPSFGLLEVVFSCQEGLFGNIISIFPEDYALY